MSTLYELTGEYQQLLDLMQDDNVDQQTILDTLEGIDGEIEIKADGYAKVIVELAGNMSTLKDEIDRLSNKKKSIENNIKQMKNSLEMAMRTTGKTKFKTELFSFNIAKNGGKKPLDIYDEVPEEFCKTEIKPDNEKIRQALENGQALPFAILQERGESLRIK